MATFNNNESGSSVRTKINEAINKVDGATPISSININGGTIDGTVIGGSTAAAISGTTGSFSGKVTAQSDTYAIGVLPATTSTGTLEQPKIAFEVRPTGSTGSQPAAYIGVEEASVNSVQGALTFATRRTNNNTVAPIQAMRIDAAGDISFYEDTGTTPKFFWDASAESLGIGTSSPSSSLHVSPTTGGGAIFSQAGYNYATVSQLVSSADALFGGGVIASSVAGQVTKTTGDAAHYIRAQISEGIAFHTNITGAAGTSVARTTNERMRITSTGNLAVNSNGSVAALDGISGIQVGNSAATTAGLAIETSNRGYLWYIGSGTSNLNLWDSTANSDRLTITSTGSVGIGTSSPSARIEASLASTASGLLGVANSPALVLTNNANYGWPTGMLFKSPLVGSNPSISNAAIWAEWQTDNNAYLGFATTTAGTLVERMRITSTGLVGIGTSTPSQMLDIVGNATSAAIELKNTAGQGLDLTGGSAGVDIKTPNALPITFATTNTERARIDASGNLLVGTTTAAGSSAPLVSKGGVTIADAAATSRGVSQEIVTGASGTFTTITVSFDSDNANGSLIVEILMTGFSGVYLDYVAGVYNDQADVVMRDNSDAGTSVALTGSAGSSWTATITTSVTHPVVKVKATAGGLATAFSNSPTVTFA